MKNSVIIAHTKASNFYLFTTTLDSSTMAFFFCSSRSFFYDFSSPTNTNEKIFPFAHTILKIATAGKKLTREWNEKKLLMEKIWILEENFLIFFALLLVEISWLWKMFLDVLEVGRRILGGDEKAEIWMYLKNYFRVEKFWYFFTLRRIKLEFSRSDTHQQMVLWRVFHSNITWNISTVIKKLLMILCFRKLNFIYISFYLTKID